MRARDGIGRIGRGRDDVRVSRLPNVATRRPRRARRSALLGGANETKQRNTETHVRGVHARARRRTRVVLPRARRRFIGRRGENAEPPRSRTRRGLRRAASFARCRDGSAGRGGAGGQSFGDLLRDGRLLLSSETRAARRRRKRRRSSVGLPRGVARRYYVRRIPSGRGVDLLAPH